MTSRGGRALGVTLPSVAARTSLERSMMRELSTLTAISMTKEISVLMTGGVLGFAGCRETARL